MFFRKVKINYSVARPRWKKSYLKPKITISGNWLENAGFKVGDEINIKVENNKLILTPISNGDKSN